MITRSQVRTMSVAQDTLAGLVNVCQALQLSRSSTPQTKLCVVYYSASPFEFHDSVSNKQHTMNNLRTRLKSFSVNQCLPDNKQACSQTAPG